MPYKAVYKNKSGQILEIEIITENGKSWLVTEGGQSAPFGLTLNDAALGEMTYVETKKTEEPMPVPEDPNRERAISILRRRLQTDFKSNEAFQNFLNGEAGLRRAIDNDFDRVSIVKIQEWGARITKATTEQGSRLDELRRHFMGTYLGDLFIEQLAEHGAKENGWDAQWTARCDKCRTFRGNIKASTILGMQRSGKKFTCGNPCGKGQ